MTRLPVLLSQIAILVTASLFIFVTPLDTYYFHPDELMHLDIADAGSLTEVLERSGRELHPPGSHIIRHIVTSGSNEVIIQRLFSIIPGIISVVLAFILGLMGRNLISAASLASLQLLTPFCVTYSFSIRNYAIFQSCLYALSVSLLMLSDRSSPRRISIFVAIAILCCSLHYSGYLFVGCSILALLIHSFVVQGKNLRISVTRHITWFALFVAVALLIPLSLISSESMIWGWIDYLYNNSSSSAFSVAPDVRSLWRVLLSVFKGFFAVSESLASILIVLTCLGLLASIRRKSIWGIFPATIFTAQLILYFLGLYPLTGSRYNTWIFIPIGMSLLNLTHEFSLRLPDRLQVPISSAICVLSFIIAHHVSAIDIFFYRNYETPITRRSWDDFLKSLGTDIPESSPVITNKVGGLYLNHQFFPGETRYSKQPLIRKTYGKHLVYFQSENFRWDYQDWRDLGLVIQNLAIKEPSQEIWFMVIALTDFSMSSLYNCAHRFGLIQSDLSPKSKEYLLFSLSYGDLSEPLSENSPLNKACFQHSRIPHLAQLMKEWQEIDL